MVSSTNVASRIVFVSRTRDTVELARRMVPSGFELAVVEAGSEAYTAALPHAEYLVGFIAGSIDDALYEAAPRLRLIQLLSAGYDTLDIASARRAGVPIANNGGANADATAEHTVLLMLAVSRHLVWQHSNVVAGRWQGENAPPRHELRGKVLGIIGLGRIGSKVARLAASFGMHVQYYDIARLPENDEATIGVQFRLFEEILRTADILSLHVPLNETTIGLIGEDELARLKPTAVVINTSRGPVVEETALVEALSRGAIAGAGLDVLTEEPPPKDHRLFAFDNVVLTPHLAGPSWESRTSMLRNAFDNIQRVARGDHPRWVVPELDIGHTEIASR